MKNTCFALILCTLFAACENQNSGSGVNGGVDGGSGLDSTTTSYPQNGMVNPNTRPAGSDSSMTDSLPDSLGKARGLN